MLGFHRRASHQILDLAECPVLRPGMVALCPALRALLAGLLRGGQAASVIMTEVEAGIDMGLELPAEPDLAALETLSEFARPAGSGAASGGGPPLRRRCRRLSAGPS
ncbi:MAG: hypothetical protein WDN69_08555 [Aliidongia sp.]